MKNFDLVKFPGRMFVMVFAVLLLISCGGNKDSKSSYTVLKTGEFKLPVPGGIWFKDTGEAKGMPVVLLHGVLVCRAIT